MDVDASLVRTLQERAARAFPAKRVQRLGGWWLRHAPGCAWWTGTVLPHGDPGPGGMADSVALAEAFCTRYGVVVGFQISPEVCPDGLDGLLAQRGYQRCTAASLQVASTAKVRAWRLPGTAPLVRIDRQPTRTWFDVWRAVSGDGVDGRAEWERLGRAVAPTAYAGVLLDGHVVAVGRAVVDTGWAGVCGMATLPNARGHGAARHVLVALAEWAAEQGADGMYLQVARENATALRLYAAAGFAEVCGYHYRVASGADRRWSGLGRRGGHPRRSGWGAV